MNPLRACDNKGNFMSYPKWIYHETKEAKVVNSKEEHDAEGNEWKEVPFDKPEEQALEQGEQTQDQAEDSKEGASSKKSSKKASK